MEKLKRIVQPRRASKQTAANDFRHWALAFIVCNFNVDLGPEVELVYPPGVQFSTADLTAFCFNSFPERQDTETAEDLTFHFTVRNHSPDILLSSPYSPHGSASTFFGYCVFRQEMDQTMKRSFNQRTLVLISNHDFPGLFFRMLHQMTSSGMISDPNALEAAFTHVSSWPPPSIGRHELPFLGSMIELDIAPHAAIPLQGLPCQTSNSTVIQSSLWCFVRTLWSFQEARSSAASSSRL